MTKDYTQVMFERSDKQLVDIVTLKRDEYQPEAVMAAEKEIERRQINIDVFNSALQNDSLPASTEPDKSTIIFEWYHKGLTVLLPAAIITFVTMFFNFLGSQPILRVLGLPAIILIHYAIHHRLRGLGYTRMAKDFLIWITYTLYIYIGLIILFGLSIYFFAM